MKKRIFSIILTAVLLISTLLVSAVSALTSGDIDGNGKITATDARKVLRASVNLETLTAEEEKAGDVDGKPGISAADARLILRAAVGLETLHVHQFTETIVKEATCASDGEKHLFCECGEIRTEVIPALPHTPEDVPAVEPTCTNTGLTAGKKCSVCGTFTEKQTVVSAKGHKEETIPAVPATCTETGLTEGKQCSVCNVFTKAQRVIPAHHTFTSVSTTNTTKCAVSGCEAELPSFNDIVNVLKSTKNGANYHTGFVESITHNDKMDISGPLASMMDDGTNVASTETTYSRLFVNSLLTPSNFPANDASYVSSLTDKDVKSIKIEKAETVSFVSSLPEKYTVGKTEYDLTPIKAAEFPTVYKITVVVPSQSFDIKKQVSGQSVFDKIYMADYNKKIESMRSGITADLDKMGKEMESLGISMSSSGNIASSLTVEYYIDAATFEPVAARYLNRFDVDFTAKIPLMVTMKQSMYMSSNSYYFFNNSFGMK